MRISFQDAVARYGEIDFQNKKWPRESEFMGVLAIPEDLQLSTWLVAGTNSPVKHVYCNKDMAPALVAALYHVKERGLQAELKTFDGLFCIRMVRGTTEMPSVHSYGLAIDLNAAENPLGGPAVFSPEFVQCFTDAGFSWGGHFHRLDGMHFSWGWE